MMLESLESRTLLSFAPISQPTTAYLDTTTNMSAAIPADGTSVAALSDGTETVSFSDNVIAQTVPVGWNTWNSPPATESATPRVLTDLGATSLTMTLSKPAVTFGFEAEPFLFLGPTPMTATFMVGASTVGSIPLLVRANAGALLFAATTDQPFTSVVLTAPALSNGFAIAQVSYGLVSTTLTGTTGNAITGVEGSSTGTVCWGPSSTPTRPRLSTTTLQAAAPWSSIGATARRLKPWQPAT